VVTDVDNGQLDFGRRLKECAVRPRGLSTNFGTGDSPMRKIWSFAAAAALFATALFGGDFPTYWP